MNQANAFPWAWLWKILGVGLGLWLLIHTWQLWFLALSALILVAAMLPAARWGERRRVPRTFTVITIYIGVALILAILGRFMVPMLVEQGSEFADKLPTIVSDVAGWLGEMSRQWAIPLPVPSAESLRDMGPGLIENTFRATSTVIGGALGLLVILFLAAYVAIDAERISGGLLVLVPAKNRGMVSALAERVLLRMGGYVRGQFMASCFVGIMLTVGLWLLGVPYALLIGGLAAVLNIVPFLGARLPRYWES